MAAPIPRPDPVMTATCLAIVFSFVVVIKCAFFDAGRPFWEPIRGLRFLHLNEYGEWGGKQLAFRRNTYI
jgi:hypothetical protein